MTTVEFRISELREASARLERSSQRIVQSADTVQGLLEPLLVGNQEPETAQLATSYYQQRALMDTWAYHLNQFATKLSEAVDDLEAALLDAAEANRPVLPVNQAQVPEHSLPLVGFSSGVVRSWRESDRDDTLKPDASPKPVSAKWMFLYDGERYVSGVNRPLYDKLLYDQQALTQKQEHLHDLIQARENTVADLEALKNRLLSYSSTVDLQTSPRVQALEAELVSLDRQIGETQSEITRLQVDAADITERLAQVQPGPGADLHLIFGLEDMQTTDWIKNHTEGCVNHIVNKLAIPGGIPLDAHLWDESTASFPQYGVTSGDVPLTGSVLMMEREHSYADDVYGHLMYVERVEDGVVWVTDNNYPDVPVKLSDLTDEVTGPNMRYLYFPWNTQA